MTKDEKAMPQQFKYGLQIDESHAVHKPSAFNCQSCNYPNGTLVN